MRLAFTPVNNAVLHVATRLSYVREQVHLGGQTSDHKSIYEAP